MQSFVEKGLFASFVKTYGINNDKGKCICLSTDLDRDVSDRAK